MRKNDLVNKIRNQALNEMPDVLNRINIDNIAIEDNYFEPVKSPYNLKRALSMTFASLFILVSGFMIYNFGYLSLVNDSNPLESETELIGFQTVSAASLLSDLELSELNSFEDSYTVTELSQTAASIEDEIELINSYMNLAETVLGNEDSYVYNDIDSDNPLYSYAFEYKGADLAGNLIEYKGYYNSNTGPNNREIITGIIIHNQKQYSFSSSQIQVGETLKSQYRIYTNNNNYVEVVDISGDKIQKFTYKVYKNGNLMNSSEVVVTTYRNNIQATMMITKNSNQQLTLEFERNSKDFENQEMKVNYSYTNGNRLQTGEFNVNLIPNGQTGNYKYQYNFGSDNLIVKERIGKGNTKATEDDFIPVKENRGNNQTSTISTEDATTTRPGQSTENPGSGNGTPGTSNDSPGNGSPSTSNDTPGYGGKHKDNQSNQYETIKMEL